MAGHLQEFTIKGGVNLGNLGVDTVPTHRQPEGGSDRVLNDAPQADDETRDVPGPSPHEQLQRAAVEGDRAALNELLLQYYDRLRDFIEWHRASLPHGGLETEDILQETFVRAIRGIATFSPTTEDAFEHWLITIARHATQSLNVAASAQKRGGKFRKVRH